MVKSISLENDIAQFSKDTRLTEPSDGRRYDWKNLIIQVKSLGRPLSEEESRKYLIK